MARRRRSPGKLDSLAHQRDLEKKYGGGTVAYYRALRRALDNYEVSPASIVGGGLKNSRKVAEQWVDSQAAKAAAKESKMPAKKKTGSRRSMSTTAARRRTERDKLKQMKVADLRYLAEQRGISGVASKNKATLVRLIAAAIHPAQKAKKAREEHGRGPFRLVVVKGGAIYGNLGPYASARAGLSDAKTLLRRMAPAEVDGKRAYSLSNEQAQDFVGETYGGGKVVDGYTVVSTLSLAKSDKTRRRAKKVPDLSAAALVVKVGKRSKAAYTPDVIPAKLRNNSGRRSTSRRNSRGSAADPVAARELVVFIENDGTLYRSQTTSIITNLAKKKAAGKFNKTLAVKGMGYLADSGARKYAKEFGDPVRGPWQSYPMAKASLIFSPATRRAAAALLLDGYMEQITDEAGDLKVRKNGVYYSVRLPAGYETKWHSPRSPLTRGAFDTKAQARAWAKKNVPGLPFDIVAFDDGAGKRSNPRVAPKAKRNAGARSNGSKSIAKLRIRANRWQDSNGNTYHRAYISVNGRRAGVTPISYGYGSQYLQTAQEWLKENGYRKPSARMSSYDAGYTDVKRKKDL